MNYQELNKAQEMARAAFGIYEDDVSQHETWLSRLWRNTVSFVRSLRN